MIPFGIEYAAEELERRKVEQRSRTMFVERVTDIMVREDRNGELFLRYNDHQSEHFAGNNREDLHGILALGGFKRIGKQEGSDIGGVYVRA